MNDRSKYLPEVKKSFIWQTNEPKYRTVRKVLEEQYSSPGVVYSWPTPQSATKEQLKVLLEYYGTVEVLRSAKDGKIKGLEFHFSFPRLEWDQIAELLE